MDLADRREHYESEGLDVADVPADRWDWREFDEATSGSDRMITSRFGAFLDRVDLFDPHYFGITPREAASLDQPVPRLYYSWYGLTLVVPH